jgi:hypothetical protein
MMKRFLRYRIFGIQARLTMLAAAGAKQFKEASL